MTNVEPKASDRMPAINVRGEVNRVIIISNLDYDVWKDNFGAWIFLGSSRQSSPQKTETPKVAAKSKQKRVRNEEQTIIY